MFHLVKSDTVPLTKELAERFRNMEPSPTEREIDGGRIRHLRQKADAGLLVPFDWASATLNGTEYRMNAQHSSAMLGQFDGNFPAGLTAHVDQYSVDSIEDLALLFRQFDDRKSSRSTADVSGAYQGLIPELRDVPRKTGKAAIEGVAWYLRMIEGVKTPAGDEVYRLFNDVVHHDFIRFLGETLSTKTPELFRAPVVAAIYGSHVASTTGARDFWFQVARGGIEYEEGAPSTALDTFLRAAHEKSDERLKNLKPANYFQGCIYAWNAYRDGRTIKDIRCDTKKGWNSIHE